MKVKLSKNISIFSLAVIAGKFLTVIGTFLIARILGPDNYGIFSIYFTIYSLSLILCLGTMETHVKEFPKLSGSGNSEKAIGLENNVFSSIIITDVIAMVIFIVYCSVAVFTKTNEIETIIDYVLLSFSILLYTFSAFWYNRFMAHQEFIFVSALEFSRAVGQSLGLIIFTWLFGLKGALIGLIICESFILIVTLSLKKKDYTRLTISLDVKALIPLIKVGLPISIMWWIYMIHSSIGRMLSMALLGAAETGYYSLGASFTNFLVLIPTTISRVLYPKVNEEIGKQKNNLNLETYVEMPSYLMGMVLPVILGVLIIGIQGVFPIFFKKYIQGIETAQILLLGGYSLSINRPGINYLVARDRQFKMVVMVVISLVVNTILSYIFTTTRIIANGIAWGTVISGMLLSLSTWIYAFKLTYTDTKTIVYKVAKIFLPNIFPVILLFIMHLRTYSIIELVLVFFLYCFIYIIILILTKIYSNEVRFIMSKLKRKTA